MPRVERYGERRVETRPLADTSRQQAEDTYASAGGPIAEGELQLARARADVGQALERVGGTATSVGAGTLVDLWRQERARQDELAVLSADRQLAELENELLHTPETGALNARGRDTLPLHDQVLEQFDKRAGELATSMATDRQRLAFERARSGRRVAISEALNRHTSAEMRAWEQAETAAYLETTVSSAIANADNPARVAEELARVETTIRQHGARIGLGPEAQQAAIDKARSQVHVGVIDRLLAQENDQGAQVYFEETRDQIAGPALARIESALEEGGRRGASQRKADEIFASTPTLEQALEAVRAIADPQLRDDVQSRIEHEFTRRAAAERQAHEALTIEATNIIDRTGDWRRIPANVWSQLTTGERASLKAYAEHRVEERAVKTDPNAYYFLSLLATSTDERLRTQFLQTNVASYVDRLSPADLKHFIDLQGSVRKGDEDRARALLTNTTNQNAMVNEALLSMGLDPTPIQPGSDNFDPQMAERVGAFRRAVREAVVRLEQEQKKAATDDQVQSIVDQLRAPTGRRVKETGRIWNSYETAYAFETAQAQVAKVTDIPAGERRRIEAALRARQQPITDAAIVALFNAALTRTRKDR